MHSLVGELKSDMYGDGLVSWLAFAKSGPEFNARCAGDSGFIEAMTQAARDAQNSDLGCGGE